MGASSCPRLSVQPRELERRTARPRGHPESEPITQTRIRRAGCDHVQAHGDRCENARLGAWQAVQQVEPAIAGHPMARLRWFRYRRVLPMLLIAGMAIGGMLLCLSCCNVPPMESTLRRVRPAIVAVRQLRSDNGSGGPRVDGTAIGFVFDENGGVVTSRTAVLRSQIAEVVMDDGKTFREGRVHRSRDGPGDPDGRSTGALTFREAAQSRKAGHRRRRVRGGMPLQFGFGHQSRTCKCNGPRGPEGCAADADRLAGRRRHFVRSVLDAEGRIIGVGSRSLAAASGNGGRNVAVLSSRVLQIIRKLKDDGAIR